MTQQFIAYIVDDYLVDGQPIAAGSDEEAVRRDAIQRTLGLGITSGHVCVQERINDILSDEDFATLCTTIDGYFAEKLPVLNA